MSPIPGYDAALAFERKARNVVYLGVGEEVCGLRVQDMTPRHLAILTEADNPFVFGGPIDYPQAAQFIGALQPEKGRNMESVLRHLFGMDIEEIAKEIFAFVDLTFLDAPTGGSDSAPIASGLAWMEYRMACEPFRWDCERTLSTPLRRIYQLLRCIDRVNGEVVVNSMSHKCSGDWLATINEGLKNSTITPEMIAELNARGRNQG